MSNKKPDGQAENFSILQYIKVTTAASDRARTVIIVMVVASVVVFTQIRNDGGWLDRRIEVRSYARKLLTPNFDEAKTLDLVDPKKRAAERLKYDRARVLIEKSDYKVCDKDAQKADPDCVKNAKNAANAFGEQVKELEALRAEHLRLVHLPFFGAVFDADDIGIFAGITFTVVLLWLSLSLNRERRNAQVTFQVAAARGCSKYCYDLLAMPQVLSVPPTASGRMWKPLGYFSRLLYIMPLVVCGWQFYLDWKTQDNGNILGWDKMTTLIRSGKVFLVVILILTVMCLITSIKMLEDWKKYADQAKS